MEDFFDKIYNSIAYLGELPKKIILNIIKSLKRFFYFFISSAKGTSKKAKLFTKIISVTAALSIIIGASAYAGALSSTKVNAIKLKINDNIIGYASDKEDAELAKNTALKVLGSDYESKIISENVKIDAHNLKSPKTLSCNIIDFFKDDLVPVTEIYINDELLGAAEDSEKAREAVNTAFKKAQKAYPNSTVSFNQAVTFKPNFYTPENENLFTIDELKSELSKKNSMLTIRRAECEEKVVSSNFDTVEVQTNQLFKGDKRVRRTGRNGADYQVNMVTYEGDKKLISEPLLNITVKKPVTQIVERGIRAGTLTLGTHTVIQTVGAFCWPVVDLYTVTSPYGPRSLGFHRGIDISGPNASGCLVVAGAGGRVNEAGWNTGGYGNYVKIDHGNGVETVYAHLLDNSIVVHAGDVVTKGQIIGQVGDTGYSFGAHLHFEVRINGNRIDPAPYLGLQ